MYNNMVKTGLRSSQDSFSVIEASSFVNCAIFCACIFVKLSQ